MRLHRFALSTATALLTLPTWATALAQAAVDKAIDVTEPVIDLQQVPPHGAAAVHGSPVPQFDPASFAGQLFWLAITFAILYIVMAKLVLPRIGRVVESRAHQIAADLEAAQAQRDATQAALAEYEVKLAAARADAQSVIGQAQQTAAQTQTIALSAQGNKISGDIQAAEERIAAAKHQALGQIAPAAASAAAAMLQKVAGITPDPAKLAAAVAAALNSKAA